jgi:hypothetical protein
MTPKTTKKAKTTPTTKPKRFMYSPSKVQQALKAVHDGMSENKASQTFNVPRTTLRNKLSGKSPEVSTGHSGTTSVLGNEIEQMLVKWLLHCSRMGFPIGRENLLCSVKKFVDESKHTIFK